MRIRCLNPLRQLQSWGFPVELFDSTRADCYSAVVYSKSYSEANYQEAAALKKSGTRIVFDLCDNHFYNPNASQALEKVRQDLKQMMNLADYLVASTEAMADVMRSELSVPHKITVIGDAVETEVRGSATPFWKRMWQMRQLSKLIGQLQMEKQNGRTPLVWFGIHGGPHAEFGMLDLLKLRPLLEKINDNFPLSLTVISNSRKKFHRSIKAWRIPTRYLAWYPETFFPALKAHSIAVIPISTNPFTRCKTNNRLALSLYAGLAVVADSIPSYQAFAEVCWLDDWERGLEGYLSNPDLRRRHVEAGQKIITEEWTLSRIADRWRDFFDHLLAKSQGHAKAL